MYDFQNVDTVYIGGGTPSSLNEELLTKLLSILPKTLETTFECNPNDIDINLMETLKSNSVSRISLGVQSFDDDLLRGIGRTHNATQAYEAIELIKQYGFDLSVDMIFNLPSQTKDQLLNDIEQVKNISHVSYYSLILEEHTILDWMIEKGKLNYKDDESFFEIVIDSMKKNGFEHYEISNFGKDHKSIHNQIYWNNDEYIGVGLAASGYLSKERYQNYHLFEDYFRAIDNGELPKENITKLEDEDIVFEHMMLGFRMLDGISIADFTKRYGVEPFKAFPKLEKLVSEDYLYTENDRIKLTKKGLFYNNDLLVKLM